MLHCCTGSTAVANVTPLAPLLQHAESVYAKALESHHRGDPVLHLFIAQYIRSYRHNTHAEITHIDAAAVRAPTPPQSAWFVVS